MSQRWMRLKWSLVRLFRGPTAAARSVGMSIGKDCRMITKDFGSEPWLLTIGDRVTVAGKVRLLTHDGAAWLVHDERGRRYQFKRTQIGNEVFVGTMSIIMPGVRIGDRCIVAAGSVVTRSVPSGAIVAGAPARIIGRYDDYHAKALTQMKADADMVGKTLRERIDSIVDEEFRPEMDWPETVGLPSDEPIA